MRFIRSAPVSRADDNENAFAQDEPLDSRQCVFQERAAADDRAKLLDPPPATELGEKVTHTRAFARGEHDTPESLFIHRTHGPLSGSCRFSNPSVTAAAG
jgi:hypothetical protein